jgi:hypothetical protein
VEGEAPQPLPEEEAKENPIKAAAQELKVTVSQWSSNPIIDIANAISQKMAQISVLYKENTPESRKQLIQLSKDIQQDVKMIATEAQRVVEACQDRVLKTQVLQGIEKMTMISQQLKIVCAVKAAEPLDLDSEKQLILCSTNLMQAVRKTLLAVEVASIRAFRVSAKAALAVVKFRKTLYRTTVLKK